MIVRFVPKIIAENTVARSDVPVISLRDPDREPACLQDGWKDILYLDFFDSDGKDASLKQMSVADAQAIKTFVDQHADAPEILVHCIAGQSRSAAVAQFIHEYQHRDLYQEQRRITVDRPYTKYNSYVYGLLYTEAYGGYSLGSAFETLDVS